MNWRRRFSGSVLRPPAVAAARVDKLGPTIALKASGSLLPPGLYVEVWGGSAEGVFVRVGCPFSS